MILFQIEKIFSREEFLLLCTIMKPPAKLNLRTFYADISKGIAENCPDTIDTKDFLRRLVEIEEPELFTLTAIIQCFWLVRGTVTEQDRLREIGLSYSFYVFKPVPDGWKYTD